AFSAGLSRAYAELGVEVAGLDVAGRVALVIGEESFSAARSTELSSPYTVVVVIGTGCIVALCVTAPVTELRIRTALGEVSAISIVEPTSCDVAGVVAFTVSKPGVGALFSAGLSRLYAAPVVVDAGFSVAGRVAYVVVEHSLSAPFSTSLSSPYAVPIVVLALRGVAGSIAYAIFEHWFKACLALTVPRTVAALA
ncbi:hypothetical protein, partial [Mammaliicoccus sciuri]|uniref:hypothetical protein n=1 Tax=Mammaliicoccus sciuri TaxID=1296 RepID=UPI001EF5801F